MLINGIFNTDYLISYYKGLIKKGIKQSEILVILLNSYKKSNFIKQSGVINTENITTFQGLCYNAFLKNIDFISKFTNRENEQINLCGLEVSQYIFKESIKTADFSDYISKVNLLHQLFRRYSLIVQNNLSDNEVIERSKILNESFMYDAQKAINDYKLKTFKYKSFDYLRQLAVLPLIYNNTDYFKNIKYLIVDNADEFSYAFWKFIDSVMPNISDYCIAYDELGSTRSGYLCAYKSGIKDFIKKYSPEIINRNIFNSEIFFNIKQGKKTKLNDIEYILSIKRLDMISLAVEKIKKFISLGIKEEEIAIITPIVDDVLTEYFFDNRIKYQVLSGSEKLSDDKLIKFILIILKLMNNIKISDYELKNILLKLLNIPFNKCYKILEIYKKDNILDNSTIENDKLTKFISLIHSESKVKSSITEQIKIIYENLIKEFNVEFNKKKYDFLLKEAQSFEFAFRNTENTIQNFITQIENSIISENPSEAIEIKKGKVVISTPQKIIDYSYKTKYQLWLDISSNEWIKNDTGTLYNAWVLSRDWNKNSFTFEDNIELTNDKTARIVRKLMFNAINSDACLPSPPQPSPFEGEGWVGGYKTSVIRQNNNITFFSSMYDNSGNENFGGINEFIKTEQKEKAEFKIIPRDDQKGVLEYKKGKLGIMAVPGAGKTTILLALVIKLINEGVKSENIFVLTYMDSAAKNFKERIKTAISDVDLPNISTIHGLALRIIKENSNYIKLGLDENFEICDDTLKENIIRSLFLNFKIDEEKYDNYLKCISEVKLSCIKGNLKSKYKDIQDFYNFYYEYNKYLKENNLIDYDDMLTFAVQLLEEHQEIRKYYQDICKYIIEDEAQDSTDIQQRLIALLSAKYNNLVRCGDINQAITSTFTNSNPNSFRNFIKQNKKVEMNSSQRCSKPIYSFANKLIKNNITPAINSEVFFSPPPKPSPLEGEGRVGGCKTLAFCRNNNAFYDIQMIGTNNNPLNTQKPEYIIFEKEKDETDFILQKIKQIRIDNPKATIAILLRLNSGVNKYNELFLSNDIKTTVRSDSPNQKTIYKIIFMFLKIISNPMNNKNIYDFALFTAQKKIYNFNQGELNFLKYLKTPFVNLHPDDMENQALLQLYFDIDYHLNNSVLPNDILALSIGLYFSKNNSDKSNTYMISTLIKRLDTNNLDELLPKLDYMAQKASGAYKFFDNFDDSENMINIMTMHKSKGDEFDYVFIPELNEENYSTNIKNVKLKTGGHFIQTIKSQINNAELKSQDELKQEQVNETLRLLYVGITRAKQELYFTNARNYVRRKNTKDVEIIKML